MDSETEDNWTWFMERLADVLVPQKRIVTFITDRNAGLINAIATVFPGWPHSFCFQHLKRNLANRYPTTHNKYMRERVLFLFMCCAYARTEEAFNLSAGKLEAEGGRPAIDFLAEAPYEKWSNAFFKGNRYGEMCNNVSESFNFWILELRSLPILDMIEGIRTKVMENMANRKIEAESWSTELCPNLELKLRERSKVGLHWKVIRSSSHVYQVEGKVTVCVDLEKKLCSCHEWRVSGFPCAHAFAAIQRHGASMYSFIDSYFKTCLNKTLNNFCFNVVIGRFTLFI